MAGALEDVEMTLQQELRDSYGDGVQKFTAVMISVSDAQNERMRKNFNKLLSTKDLLGNKLKVYSVSAEFPPELVERLSRSEIQAVFCRKLIDKLHDPSLPRPKGFDWNQFASDVQQAVSPFLPNAS